MINIDKKMYVKNVKIRILYKLIYDIFNFSWTIASKLTGWHAVRDMDLNVPALSDCRKKINLIRLTV